MIAQEGEHDPAEDARAALALFKAYRREWEGPTAQLGKNRSGVHAVRDIKPVGDSNIKTGPRSNPQTRQSTTLHQARIKHETDGHSSSRNVTGTSALTLMTAATTAAASGLFGKGVSSNIVYR